ncbi:MAG: carboxypeptidase M32 [Planctomycetota bacterium]
MADTAYADLIERVREFSTLGSISSVLQWDQEVMMPPKGAEFRAKQLGLMSTLHHRMQTDPAVGRLIKKLRGRRLAPVPAANLRLIARQYERATKLPADLVRELSETRSRAQQVWAQARRASNFRLFAPWLEKLVTLKRRVIALLKLPGTPYDTLLDQFEEGATCAAIDPLFGGLREQLVPLVRAIVAAPHQPRMNWIHQPVAVELQREFGLEVIARFGFDSAAGRVDVSVHPFCSGFCTRDVRMTTRFREHDMQDALGGLMHETGHGLYDQGLPEKFEGEPAGDAISLGIHESQSRMWENFVGRSPDFWRFWFPRLQKRLGGKLKGCSLDQWVHAYNLVTPSLIRVEADEVTYPLHVMLRYQIEKEIFNERLPVAKVEARWNELMREYLGVTPPNAAQGVLQDIHWSMGAFGYFPTYLLGNLYAAQFFATADRKLGLNAQFRRGNFAPLLTWLRENIHRHGHRYSADQLVRRATGKPLDAAFFVEYLTKKYSALYRL